MKFTVRAVQVFVAILFIISGLVKANDPLGLSYKMQEFFELWSQGFAQGSFARNSLDYFHRMSLTLSIAMITLEVMAGIALLLGWKKKFILWMLLLLIVFFTFLTGYAYLSGKFTNCGCFGDCLPISPLTSFIKDIVLLVMIVFLLVGQKHIQTVFNWRTQIAILSLSLVFSLALQWYVLNYLPIADCLPFKKGNNIPEQMKLPKDAIRDSTAMYFVYEKNGKRYEWPWDKLPADYQTYKYVERIDKVVKKGNGKEAPIKGFSLSGGSYTDSTSGSTTTADSTTIVLTQPLAVIGFGLDTIQNAKWLADFKELVRVAASKKLPVYFATNERRKFLQGFAVNGINVQVFATDFTIIRTAARTNPSFYILKNGTITGKYSYRNLNDLINDLDKN